MATPFVQEDVNRSLGALLAGTWLNSGLVAIELLQATKYFSRRPESKATNALVVLLLTLDTLSTISDYACVWLYSESLARAEGASSAER